ncbi:hypothetical protein [Streptomyces jumonjinensis]|uniref:hypothetical protein n=1 Tax=Streptomyces jumonjinensis TaxID=1945 RepID=UPI0037A55BB1
MITLYTTATVAFNGPDNTGKTKHIGILSRRIGTSAQSTGPLHSHDRRWAGITSRGIAAWWFDHGPVEEVADVLAGSYLTRAGTPSTGGIRFTDRGLPMLEASLKATIAIREDLNPQRAAERARHLLKPFADDLRAVEEAEYGLVLLHHEDLETGVVRSLSSEASVPPLRRLPASPARAGPPARRRGPLREGDRRRRPVCRAGPGRDPPSPRTAEPAGPRPGPARRSHHGPGRHVGERQEHRGRIPARPARLRTPEDRPPERPVWRYPGSRAAGAELISGCCWSEEHELAHRHPPYSPFN